MKPVIFMFSGQGSHYYQMGRELFEQHPVFKYWMQLMDDMIQDMTGKSVLNVLYDEHKSKTDLFDQTSVTSLAIIMVEYALAKVMIETGIEPDYILGSSLGEVTASVLADTNDLQQTLQTVLQRVQLYEEHCQKGGMISILGNTQVYEESANLNSKSELAAINFDSHFVISYANDKLEDIEDYLNTNNLIFQRLNVSQGFHSSLLEPAKKMIQTLLKDKTYRKPKAPLISCTRADHIQELDQHYFWDVFRKPIQFQKTIQTIEADNDYIYLDLGPSGTLAGFVKYNLSTDSQSEFFPIMTPFGGELNRLNKAQQLFSNS